MPIRRPGSAEIVAIGEFYQDAITVRTELKSARVQSWAVTGAISLSLIAALYTVVARGSRLIEHQRADLDRQVHELTLLLSYNEDLRQRVKSATQRSAKDTEAHLRRIGSDLHDGVGQLIAIVMLKLNDLFSDHRRDSAEYVSVHGILDEAMAEIRDMAAGLALPEIEQLSLADAIGLIVARHRRRTQTDVSLVHSGDEVELPQPLKVSACRFVQEALNNAYKHADGRDQAVVLQCKGGELSITVSDGGPGIVATVSSGKRQTLGLSGLRNRLESLGGALEVTNRPGGGAEVRATFLIDGLDTA